MIHLIIFVLSGLVWCTGSAGAEEIRTWTAFRQEDGLGANPVMAGLQARDGTIWFATAGGGVSRYDGRVWQTYTVADGLPGNWVLDLREASDGRIWAAIGHGLEEDVPRAVAQFVDGAWQAVPMPEQVAGRLGTRQIQALEGGMACVVSLQGQMAHYNGAAWQVVSRSEGRPLRGVQCLYRAQDGTLWVAYTSRRQRGARGRGLEGRRGRRLGGGVGWVPG